MRISIVGRVLRGFKDTFIRTNQPLERSSDGSLWTILRGSWSVVSNKLNSSSAASTYPLTTVNTPSANVDISIKDISQGITAALWVTDGGNWWGIGIDQIQDQCGCYTCYNTNYNANNQYYYYCGDNFCEAASYYYCCNVVGNRYCASGRNCKWWNNANGCLAYYACNAWNAGNCNAPTNCFGGYYWYDCGDNYCSAYNTSNFAGYTPYTCGCVTCYPQYIRLIRSALNTVTEVVSTKLSESSIARSLKLLVRGNQVTAKVYSNTDLTGQIGADLVYTPTDVAIQPRYGIMVKPSSYGQGSTNGEINIEAG